MRSTLNHLVPACVLALTLGSPATAAVAPGAAADDVAGLGAHWVARQFLDDGSVIGRTGSPDVPNTIAAALALDATGYDLPMREASLAYVAERVDAYVRDAVDDYSPTPTTGGDRPGPLGNLLLFVEAVGEDPRDFGGHDLVARLEASEHAVGPEAGSFGRAVDVFGATYAHATAVLGLVVTEGAAPSDAAVAHLLDLQCAGGGFPSGYRTVAQRVVDDCTGDSNATGLALAALAGLGVEGEAARDAAVGFLLGIRNDDGGWGYTPGDPTDGNSTGLAALGLRAAGHDVSVAVTAVASLQFGCGSEPDDLGGIRFLAADARPNSFATFQALLAFGGGGHGPAPDERCVELVARATTDPAGPSRALPATGGGAALAGAGVLLAAAWPVGGRRLRGTRRP